jgi:hypothetical protein
MNNAERAVRLLQTYGYAATANEDGVTVEVQDPVTECECGDCRTVFKTVVLDVNDTISPARHFLIERSRAVLAGLDKAGAI